MKQNKITLWNILFFICLALTLVSTYFLLQKSELKQALMSEETLQAVWELVILGGTLFSAMRFPEKRPVKVILSALITAAFLWIHQILLPILACGIYILYLILLGIAADIPSNLHGADPADQTELHGKQKYAADTCLILSPRLLTAFLKGCALQLLITAAVSAFGIGGTDFSRLQVLVTGVTATGIFWLKSGRKLFQKRNITSPFEHLKQLIKAPRQHTLQSPDSMQHLSAMEYFLFTLIAVSLLLQAGRMNIALDYDALHYGLRSAYVLDNGRGIYENLGSVNDVYVYPKGLEVLCLPLSGLPSYSFVTAFSWCMTVMGLVVSGCIVYEVTGSIRPEVQEHRNSTARMAALCCVSTLSMIPGIMNLAASAKTDAITLAFQLTCLLYFLKKQPVMGMSAAVMSLCFKPTSFLFSLLLSVTGLIYSALVKYRDTGCFEAGRSENKSREAGNRDFRTWWMLFLSIAATVVIIARTVKLAGVPLTTAGLSLWNRLGFELKYPFHGLAMSGGEEQSLIKRIIGVFACPVGEDMDHVYIAWASLLVPMCILVVAGFAVRCFTGRKKGNLLFLTALLALTGASSLYCIGMLAQVDGNYFMLLYALAVITAFAVTTDAKKLLQSLVPAAILACVMCLCTNWAGDLGLSPIKLVHAGYYDHEAEIRENRNAQGKGDIYDLLSSDPRTRVFAFALQPECLDYPCNIQSYTDLEGNGGNVEIVKTLNQFKDFLDYAGVQYIYVEDDFLATRSRAEEIIRYMEEDESLVTVIEVPEAGTKLCRYTGKR